MKTKLWLFISALVLALVSAVRGQTNAPMTDIGAAAPPQGPYDIAQTLCTYCGNAHGTYDGPDGLNYYTDNGPNHGLWAGQTFTTGTNSAGYNLASVSIKTAGVDDGGGYASPQTFHLYLYLYSVSGGAATLLAHFTNYSSQVDGDWVQWNMGTNTVTLAPGSTYAYSFGRDSSGSGYAGLGNASGNPYPGGELAMLPTSGGAITFGGSHSYDATFEIGLNAVGAPTVAVSANPPYGLAGQSFTITATVIPGRGTVTNVTANLNAIGGLSAASLVLSNANVYTNTFTVPAGAPLGIASLTVTATDTTPLAGADSAVFTVLTRQTATINSTQTFQTIEGLGAATVFYDWLLPDFPYANEVYTNLFVGLNVSMLRLGDWYSYQTPLAGFDGTASEIVANASRVLGHPVPVYMSSWSPPAFLKSNGQYGNGTLLYTNGAAGVSYDYSGFAQYWYDSINAYRSNGISPTWISIQNEPDFNADYGSCLLEPAEQGTNAASYPKALDAVYNLITNLPSPPKLLAPECVHISYGDLQGYASVMNTNHYYGLAHHLYGDSLDPATLSAVTNMVPGKPRFMTEFGLSDMIQQATLLHNELVYEQVSGYNYWDYSGLISLESNTGNPSSWTNAPPGIPEPHGWWFTPAYWAMKHFSFFINPGFKRVGAADSDNNVLISAYVSPDNLRLVAVLINTSASAPSIKTLNYGAFAAGKSSVYQTVGTNTWQSLGALVSPETLPPQSLTTIVLDKIVTVGAASNPSPTNGASGVSLNSTLSWTPGSNAVTHAVYLGTSANAVANATPASPEFQGVAWTNQFSLWAASWGATYYWRVDEIAYSNTNHGSVWSVTTAPAVQLPSPWQSQDIGITSGQTGAIYTDGVFTMTGLGADIWNPSDAFRFAYMPVTGNCTIIARVTSVQNTDPWSKAGVMIRDSLGANSTHAFMCVTPGNGVAFQYRSSTGGSSSNNNTTGPTAPYWVKLVRNGNTFTGYSSPDGVNWTQQGTVTFTMASTAYVGLALTSHNSSSLCTATFDNVTAPGWPLLPGAPGGLTATAGNAQVALSWAPISGASSYNLKSATNNGGPYTVLTNVATTTYTNTGLLNGMTCYYVVSALNIAGESTNSVPASATPQAPPQLDILLSGANLQFTWPVASTGFTLQSTTNLMVGDWANVTSPAPQNVSNQWQVTLPRSDNAGSVSVFYRLSK
jgi:glucuronoarabinoxylan endo-1,4-beta-xylanase